jgi:hypothetical protein
VDHKAFGVLFVLRADVPGPFASNIHAKHKDSDNAHVTASMTMLKLLIYGISAFDLGICTIQTTLSCLTIFIC